MTQEEKDMDNSDPKSINDYIPYKESEVICVSCSYRWLAERPVTKPLKDIECPWCGKQGFVIETGETIKQINNEKDMNEKEQTNTMRYIDKLICDVERVLMGLGYKVFTELNGSTKVWCVELLNANSSEGMPIRHKSMIRGLVKGYLHSFDYFGGTQKIYIYDECKGLHPEDGRYSTLEYAMSRVSDTHKNDLFVNYGTHTERYVIDNNDKQTVNIAISEPKKIKTGKI